MAFSLPETLVETLAKNLVKNLAKNIGGVKGVKGAYVQILIVVGIFMILSNISGLKCWFSSGLWTFLKF